ncbi:MAG TPA: PEGA domain-containing protein [Ignavibacteriaceae bacterium]|nr:PEGA domain-containing protein [Ignavibacteriaceae bacterium]
MQSYSQDCKGTLIIKTDREESLIFLNDEMIGRGNIQIELEEGNYEIIVKEGSNNWENKNLTGSVELKECNHQTLTFNFNDEIYLQTNPQDVAVFSNDSLIGYTPLYLANNFSNLQLRKPGYENKLISLDEVEKNKALTLDYIGKIKETSFYERDLFKYLLAGIVVLGGTTAYFKLKADQKFEEYEITGEQKLLDETERYDLISGITFTALQINFGALIYFFLDE